MFNNNCNDGFSDIIALAIVAMIFGWGGYGNGIFGGGGQGGATANYVLGSDFATIQRQLSDGFGSTEAKLDSVNNGLCSLGYDQLGQMNTINTNIMQGNNALQAQLAQCCCDNKSAIAELNYNLATQACATNTNIANATRDIMDAIKQQAIDAKDAKIAEQAQQISALQLSASQQAQNTFLINQLRPQPVPAFNIGYVPYGFGLGTTIA